MRKLFTRKNEKNLCDLELQIKIHCVLILCNFFDKNTMKCSFLNECRIVEIYHVMDTRFLGILMRCLLSENFS